MRSLAPKLLLAFLLVSLTVALLGAGLIHYTTQRNFENLVLENVRNDFIERAQRYYQANGSWHGYPQFFFRFSSQQASPPQPPQRADPPQSNPQRLLFGLIDANSRVIIPAGPYRPGKIVPASVLEEGIDIEIDGQVVGTVITTGEPLALAPRERQFLENSNRALFYATLGAIAVALFLSFFLTRRLTRPLRELTGAIQVTAKGELGQQVAVRSNDEIGQLAQAFNQMSRDLARLDKGRRQMSADIAHDLRTPLTVIAGYIESMQDGVLPPHPNACKPSMTK